MSMTNAGDAHRDGPHANLWCITCRQWTDHNSNAPIHQLDHSSSRGGDSAAAKFRDWDRIARRDAATGWCAHCQQYRVHGWELCPVCEDDPDITLPPEPEQEAS